MTAPAAALCHGFFTLRRSWATPPTRVFAAWADAEVRARWFVGPPGWQATQPEMDVRPGGEEWDEGGFATGITTSFHTRYHLVERGARLVFAHRLRLSGTFHSFTLASLLLTPEAERTAVAYTEQIVFLDGQDGTAMRQEGTEEHFAAIPRALGLEEQV